MAGLPDPCAVIGDLVVPFNPGHLKASYNTWLVVRRCTLGLDDIASKLKMIIGITARGYDSRRVSFRIEDTSAFMLVLMSSAAHYDEDLHQ